MKKRVLSLLMTAVLVIAMAVPVMASDTGTWTGQDANGYGGTFTKGAGSETSSGKTKVTATVASDYTVMVPAALPLVASGTTYSGEYTLGAKGNIAVDKKLAITPTSSFTMTQVENSSVTATGSVTQAKTDWVKSSSPTATQVNIDAADGTGDFATFAVTTGSATVELTSAGTYNGTITFTFGLEDLS